MKFKTALALIALFLTVQGEAYDPDKLNDTISATVSSAKGLLTNIINVYSYDPIVCDDYKFKAKIIATSALCQLQDDLEAMQTCQNFGDDCIAIPGRWGCGKLEGGERGCYFRPTRVPRGSKVPKIVFDDETEDDMRAGCRGFHYQ
ncbi:hypothetical protein BGZ49_009388 [Haplosporangium sp. Z 27]|nr:hypothetical protein BGZ49_009388 [Haplosporangium sp. Z 27]